MRHFKFAHMLYLGAATAAIATTSPAWAQAAGASNGGDIIVTARRVEERLQDVPISITVFNQEQLSSHNVTSGEDLAKITAGLTTNAQFGNEHTVFSLRGFTQDIGTAPTVGVYFADVVAPRGGSSGNFAGDGAGVGNFFDLQNVQVLKGPQGTLQGRNTTGGAVMLVPQKPTDRFEGYVEGSVGNHNAWGLQAVVNVPLSDTIRVRLGIDRQKRDGYIRNVTGLGVPDFNDTNYTALRGSIVMDITPDLENYTIASYARSNTHGAANKLFAIDPNGPLTAFIGAEAELRREAALGFYTASSIMPDQQNKKRTWQVINTTTWKATDNLTIKNIVSYAELRILNNDQLFSTDFNLFGGPRIYSNMIHSAPGIDTTSQSTFTEELQFQGKALDGKLRWQAGAYYEKSSPLGDSGNQTVGFGYCPAIGTSNGVLPGCYGIPGVGVYNFQVARTNFRDTALYAQFTYDLAPKLSLTGGFRYTWDKMESNATEETRVITDGVNANILQCIDTFTPPLNGTTCPLVSAVNKSSAPTWLIDLDFKPTPDILVYAKYARGYRAGGVKNDAPNLSKVRADLPNFQSFRPEKLDAFEVGLKSSFHGAVSGTFNVSAFYNKFSDQQVQLGLALLPNAAFGGLGVTCTLTPYRPCPVATTSGGSGTSAPVNVGKSRTYGIDVDLTLNPAEGLSLFAGYAYVNSRTTEIGGIAPVVFQDNIFLTFPLAQVGKPSTYSPEHKLVLNAAYTLPLSESIGKVTLGATVTYTSSYYANFAGAGHTTLRVDGNGNVASTTAETGIMAAKTLLDLNLDWKGVGGTPIDLSLWATNVTGKKYIAGSSGLIAYGFEIGQVGAPRMFGLKAKVHF